jgi:hypothetical protein
MAEHYPHGLRHASWIWRSDRRTGRIEAAPQSRKDAEGDQFGDSGTIDAGGQDLVAMEDAIRFEHGRTVGARWRPLRRIRTIGGRATAPIALWMTPK